MQLEESERAAIHPNCSQKIMAVPFSPLHFKEFVLNGSTLLGLIQQGKLNFVTAIPPQKKPPEHMLNAILKSSETSYKLLISK